MYGVVVLLHVLGAFAFVMAHGVSMFIGFRLRSERDPARQVLLFELSSPGMRLMYLGLGVLLLAGILAGFLGELWGRLWIWAALGTLVVVIAVMYSVATPFYGRMRAAAGAPVPDQVGTDEAAADARGPRCAWRPRTGRSGLRPWAASAWSSSSG